jgi:predicted Zn-dependent protease
MFPPYLKIKNFYAMKKELSNLMLLLVIAILVLPSCAINPVTGRKQLMFMSESQEIRMGSSYDPQVISAFGEYKSEALLSLIEERGREMGLISHRPGLEYHFRILDSPVINAFAVPGGYIYFTRGILAQFNNEAEMIGVLGHEMGHITARHSVSRQAKQTLGQVLLIGGMIASEEFRKYGEYAMEGMQLLFLSFSREDEREADRLGVEYTSKIGYDAGKMADFYRILIKMNLDPERGGVPTWLSTHPDPGNRYNDVLRDAATWKDTLGGTEWKVNTENYLRLIDGMVYGDDPRQGFTEGNVFYHPELKFQFPVPAGWKLENSPLQVRMAPADGSALIVFTFASGGNLNEAAQSTMQQLELNVVDRKNITVNGLPAVAIISEQRSQGQTPDDQQSIKVLSYFIDYNNTYYVFHGVSSGAGFDNYSGQFLAAMNGFDRLTDPSRLNVQPDRVKVVTVGRAGTLADALRSFGVQQQQMEEIAFLNNMELDEQVTPGKLIKITGK